MRARLTRPGETYLTTRYRWEWLDALYQHIAADPTFEDTALYASTAFMYRPTDRVKALLKEVWFSKTRWHLHDQLYLAYAVANSGCHLRVIEQSYLKCQALTYIRNRKVVVAPIADGSSVNATSDTKLSWCKTASAA